MVFRADEEVIKGREVAKSFFLRRLNKDERVRSERVLDEILFEYGPVIENYPSWHPLVNSDPILSKSSRHWPQQRPGRECGYKGLDHTGLMVGGFITCPYGDGEDVINSVESFVHPIAEFKAEKLDVPLYASNATPILVTFKWTRLIRDNSKIPASIAVPLILSDEIPAWEYAEVAETWESMRPYFLGTPSGKLSSFFIDQKTGQTIKTIWQMLINTGMFGPIRVD